MANVTTFPAPKSTYIMASIDTLSQGKPRSKISLLFKILRLSILTFLGLMLTVSILAEAREDSPETTPMGWRTSYTQIHFDNVETLQASVGPSFSLATAGIITGNPGEVIFGSHSIKGSYSGTENYTPYLLTDPTILPLIPLHSYRITFDYRILVVPDMGFETLFYSPTGGAQGNWLPSITITGQPGDSGTAQLTNTLGNYTDYRAVWNIIGKGAISVDNIKIENLTTKETLIHEDAEQLSPNLAPGLRLGDFGIAYVTTDTNQIIDGNASVLLSQNGWIETDPNVLPLSSHEYYLVEFDYQILDRGTNDSIAFIRFQPVGVSDPKSFVSARHLLKNANAEGNFSAGALTADDPLYTLHIETSEDALIVIDNLKVIRQETSQISSQPANWALLPWTPYPRLGNFLVGTTTWIAQGAVAEGEPYTYSVDKIEERLAFSDVVAGVHVGIQSFDTDFVRRMRMKNPSIIILPYRIAQEQAMDPSTLPPADATIDPYFVFREGVREEWIVKDTHGNPIPDPDWIHIRKMNISEFSPVIGGQTFNDYLIDWVINIVMASGGWDGIFFDNLFDRINSHILNYNDPALLNYDVNLNGLRDETPAWASEMTRDAVIKVLQRIRDEVGDLEIILGNTGPSPAIYLAQYVNGYVFECWDEIWYSKDFPLTNTSESGWRRALEEYFMMQANSVSPHINILEGCGRTGTIVEPNRKYLEPSEEDIDVHRFTLGTALLGNGFYEYDLFDNRSAPYWFDEYSVDRNGVAVEDRSNKGYLGLALNEAFELKSPAIVVWEESFDGGTLPEEMWAESGIYLSQNPDDVISGSGSLVFDNPDHTQKATIAAGTDPSQIVLTAGETYVIEYDWVIQETLDGLFETNIWGGYGDPAAYRIPGVVKGDTGKAYIPITLFPGSDFSVGFYLSGGGGKVAIDNIRLIQGGVGPWQRDFENGFVLVNPIHRPHTFNAAELAGPLNRTGIRRILGTQAPLVNNGQPVTDSLTLGPFDAIILLADHIPSENQLKKIYLPLSVKE